MQPEQDLLGPTQVQQILATPSLHSELNEVPRPSCETVLLGPYSSSASIVLPLQTISGVRVKSVQTSLMLHTLLPVSAVHLWSSPLTVDPTL